MTLAARRIVLGLCAGLVCAVPAAGQPPEPETIALAETQSHRMTVPIRIGGQGPYRFIVDTGSERTVISRELATGLRLEPGLPVQLHSMTEVSRVATAIVPALRVGRRTVSGVHAPILAHQALGADGLLGVDSLASQRVDLNFRTNEMTITRSRHREERWDGDTIVVTARSRFGRLVLVDARLDGERVYVILDTGSQVSVANEALRRRLQRRGRLAPTAPIEVVSVTGGAMTIDYGVARRMQIGGIEIVNLPLGFADVEPFRKLELTERPAILLGMDALQLFDRVSMDFATRRVRLQMPAPGVVRRPAAP